MPSGIEIRDASGNVIFDTVTQTIKFFGNYTIGYGGHDVASGSITDNRFTAYAGHEPFYLQIEGGQGSSAGSWAPIWTFNGNTLSWSYPNPSVRPTERISYGVVGKV